MQNIIKLITVSLLVFILGIFYLSLNRSSNYDTKFLVGNKIADIKLQSLQSEKFFTNDNFKFHLKDLKLVQDTNFKAVIGQLKVNDLLTKEERVLKPEIRIYDNPQTLTYEASIQTNFIRDYYLTMSNIDRSDYYNIKFQKKPLMIWIWISVVMLSLGGFLSLLRHAKYN